MQRAAQNRNVPKTSHHKVAAQLTIFFVLSTEKNKKTTCLDLLLLFY